MILSRVSDSWVTYRDIVEFIVNNPSDRFGSIEYFRDNFNQMIRRLYDNNFFIVMTDRDGLQGICGWCLVSGNNQDDIGKGRWVLPDDINGGNILYVAVCILNESCNMWKVREFFNDLTSENNIGEALWFSRTWRRRKLKQRRELNKCALPIAVL